MKQFSIIPRDICIYIYIFSGTSYIVEVRTRLAPWHVAQLRVQTIFTAIWPFESVESRIYAEWGNVSRSFD